MERIYRHPKSKITTAELERIYAVHSYQELVAQVKRLEQEGIISPIMKQGRNGKNPWLYNGYWIHKKEEQFEQYREEVLYLDPRLFNGYYLKNLKTYAEDRVYVQRVQQYFQKNETVFMESLSYNERSFELFCREKFILKESGKRILGNLGLSLEDLNCYVTCEPLAYYSCSKEIPQNVLIVENKDTYYTIRKKLIHGDCMICGKKIGTVIYGAGKGIFRSIHDLHTSVEEYVADPRNIMLYFGDMDYEGIGIYETLATMEKECNIIPLVEAYEKMLDKVEGLPLPNTKEKQNRNITGEFFTYFSSNSKNRMMAILKNELYIPQECLHETDM